MAKPRVPEKLQAWIEARRRYRLSHAHVQMARELGMNPKRLGGKANHKQEPWKAPLPVFIEDLYERRFGRRRPERVVSIATRAKELARKKALARENKRVRRSAADQGQPGGIAIEEVANHEETAAHQSH